MLILKKELRSNIKLFIIWAFVLFLFSYMIAPFIDTVMKDSEEMINFIKSLPKFMVKIFNISENSITPEGFFGMKIMMMAQIFAGVFSIILASNLFANEFENKTIEYLLVKPISRKKIYLEKLIAILIFYTLFFLIFCTSVLALFKVYVSYEYSPYILFGYSLYLYVIEIFFGCLTIFLSVIFQKTILSISLSLSTFILMYIIDILGSANEKISFLRYLSIFKYISIGDTINNNVVYINNSIILILLGFVISLFGLKIFTRKDVNI
ncbi:hypothetical protein Ob7_08132 [Thermosipho africanus Ob7]|uniref:ABC transporter permease subunit n=1 Tax=Thermosipho africanus TaxID=2421 RepID=UPI000E0A4258|nr:ABC transporter permease subunit [Thermosipho africanus]RDI90671.1 hypothetical protein Ob7_08132 [Thermosipho africanus Ob7]